MLWFSFTLFLVLSSCSLSAPPTFNTSDPKDRKIVTFLWSVDLMCSEWRKPLPPLLQTYSIIFVHFVIKLWKKALKQKYLCIFFLCFHQISLLLSNSWKGWVSFNWASIFLIYFRKIGLWGDFWFVFSFVVFQIFREWANVIGLCSPFLLWVKCPFLSLWKPSGSATSISGRSHWCFMFELFLPAGNLRHYRLIGQNLWECTLCLF